MSAAERRSLGSPVSTWTRQGCMLVPLGARAATSRMRSINSRGTGVGRKARTERRVAIAASTTAAASESVTRHALLLRDAHHELAEVLALEQAHEGLGRVVEAVDHVLAVLDPALAQPLADLGRELPRLRLEVPDDETANGEALRQDGAEDRGGAVRSRRQLGHVVVGDEPAHGHAREVVEEREHRIPHRAADVLEIDVDALRAGGLELLREIRCAVVDGGVEAELLDQRSAFVGAAGDADGAASFELRDLADERADRSGRRGDSDGLARLRLADVEETRIGRHARHAEDAERRRGRRRRGVDLAQLLAVEDGVFLPAAHAEREVAGRKFRVARAHHLAEDAAGHDLADADRLRIGLRVAHPPAHVGIEGEPERAQQDLAWTGLGDRRALEPEVDWLRLADGARGEHDAAVLFGHDRLPSAMPNPSPKGRADSGEARAGWGSAAGDGLSPTRHRFALHPPLRGGIRPPRTARRRPCRRRHTWCRPRTWRRGACPR